MFGAKAQIAALEKGLDFELIMVPFEMKRLYHPKHPEVVRVNPKQQVPVLIHGDVEIFDSTQIFEYVEHLRPQPPLWPADPADRARARLLELKSDEVYFPPIIRLMSLQETPADPVAVAARGTAARYYDEMESGGARSRISRRRVFVRRHRILHGAAVRRAHGRADDRRASAPRAMARPDDRATGGAAGRGPMAAFLVSQGRPLPDFMAAVR